jgi:putative inorganic carbon (HCO3(-)) transporter
MQHVENNGMRLNPVYREDKSFAQKLRRIFIIEKLYNTTGFVLLLTVGIMIAVGTAESGIVFGAIFIVGVAAFPLIYGIVAYPNFGMIVLIVMAYLLFTLGQFGVEGPIGTVMDGLQVLLLLGVLIKVKREQNWAVFKSPITVVVFMWLGYNLLEAFNPISIDIMAWVSTVRSVAIVALCYFVFTYNIRSVKYMRLLFTIWLILTVIASLYAYKQEYIGFNQHELQYLSMPGVADLLFIDGHWRKFSIFSDPVAFAYNMVMPSIFLICLITLKMDLWKKIGLGLLIALFLNSMLFSGTRGANPLLPAALVLFAILRYNRKVLVFSCFAALFLLFLIYVPTSNVNLYRFQSAFKPNNDQSYNLRKRNQKRIQPYILAHPMGGGLGSTGVWGKKYAPDSYLAQFPPDSGYIRVAVEDGWIGLLVFCTFMFIIIRTGIVNYYKIEDPELKVYCLAMTLIIFAYNLANFPQEALVQFPSSILFYFEAALINVTLRLDLNLRAEKKKTLQAASLAA